MYVENGHISTVEVRCCSIVKHLLMVWCYFAPNELFLIPGSVKTSVTKPICWQWVTSLAEWSFTIYPMPFNCK